MWATKFFPFCSNGRVIWGLQNVGFMESIDCIRAVLWSFSMDTCAVEYLEYVDLLLYFFFSRVSNRVYLELAGEHYF